MKRRDLLKLAPAPLLFPAASLVAAPMSSDDQIRLHGRAIAELSRALFPEADSVGVRIACLLPEDASVEVSALKRQWREDLRVRGEGLWIEKLAGNWSSRIGYY